MDKATSILTTTATVPVHLVHGRADTVVGLDQSVIHAARVRAAGGEAHRHIIERAGHFDLLAPFAPAWAEARSVIMNLLWVEEPVTIDTRIITD